jgi:hypothetical protein
MNIYVDLNCLMAFVVGVFVTLVAIATVGSILNWMEGR